MITEGFVVEASLLNFLIGVAVPLLVGVVSKQLASSSLKAWLNAVLSFAGGLLAAVAERGGVVTREVVMSALTTWIVAIAAYHGFLKPTGIAPAVQQATATFGLGPPTPRPRAQVPPPPPDAGAV